MKSKNNKNLVALFSAILIMMCAKTANADKSIFDGMRNTVGMQEQIICSCTTDSVYYYGESDEIRAVNLCIHAFLTTLKSINGDIPESVIFSQPYVKFGIGIYMEWTKERIQEEINKKQAWVDQYPFELEPMYKCADLDSVLDKGKMLIVYDSYLHNVDQKITLRAFIKDTCCNKINEITIIYKYQLAFIKGIENQAHFKESLEHFVQTIKKSKRKIASKNGLLFESFKQEFGRVLIDIFCYSPVTFEYAPDKNINKLIFEYGQIGWPE